MEPAYICQCFPGEKILIPVFHQSRMASGRLFVFTHLFQQNAMTQMFILKMNGKSLLMYHSPGETKYKSGFWEVRFLISSLNL